MLVIVLYYSNSNVGKIQDPVTTLDYHRTLVYWLYDVYWNVMLGQALALGILNDGFGFYGQEYYDWLHDFYLWESETIAE